MKTNMLNGSVLAFIGDAILSLKVRDFLVHKGYTKAKDLQVKSTIFVGAVGQAKFMNDILEKEILSEKEFDIYKRGRNANIGSTAKNVGIVTYRVASGLESLFGYLYYEDTERLDELFNLMLDFYAYKF